MAQTLTFVTDCARGYLRQGRGYPYRADQVLDFLWRKRYHIAYGSRGSGRSSELGSSLAAVCTYPQNTAHAGRVHGAPCSVTDHHEHLSGRKSAGREISSEIIPDNRRPCSGQLKTASKYCPSSSSPIGTRNTMTQPAFS